MVFVKPPTKCVLPGRQKPDLYILIVVDVFLLSTEWINGIWNHIVGITENNQKLACLSVKSMT